MKRPDRIPDVPDSLHAWLDEHVEPYLDGELTGPERTTFEQGLATDPRWQDELALARRIRKGLRQSPTPACPPEVTGAVLAEARRQAGAAPGADRPPRRRARFRAWTRVMKPSLAMVALVSLVVAAALVGRVQHQPPPSADVHEALQDVQWTLAYLSNIGRGTGATVREDVLNERIVAPMQDALNTVFNESSP